MKKEKIIIVISTIVIILISTIVCFMSLNKNNNTYTFNFSDGYIPGTTYIGKINLTTGEVDYKYHQNCDIPNDENCVQTDKEIKGTLNKEQTSLVKEALKIDINKNNHWLLYGVECLLKGNEICDDKNNKTCEKFGTEFIKSMLK